MGVLAPTVLARHPAVWQMLSGAYFIPVDKQVFTLVASLAAALQHTMKQFDTQT